MSGRLDGSTALVSGAGGGIGAATALRLAEDGARLALFDRREELLEETAEACARAGAEVSVHGVDQTDREAVEAAVDALWGAAKRVDVVFANAGYGRFAPFLQISESDWHRHVDVNLSGTFHVCQTIARRMAADQGGGSIVINASSGAVTHADQLSAYCTTKAALRMLVKGMAAELGTYRIRVNGVMPGVIETAMTTPMLDDSRHRDWVLSETPVGRLGSPQDVAALVAFLSSPEAGYISGECVLIDGGETIHGHPRWFRLDYREAYEENWKVG